MRIIDRIQEKIKKLESFPFLSELTWGLLVFGMMLFTFSLGMDYERSRMKAETRPQIIESPEALQLWNEYQQAKQQNQSYFASKNGSVVYPVGCSRGNTIKEENKIFFSSLEEALNQGYREATGC